MSGQSLKLLAHLIKRGAGIYLRRRGGTQQRFHLHEAPQDGRARRAFALPPVADIGDAKLYKVGKAADFPHISPLLRGHIHTKVIRDNYDDLLRVARSIQRGVVPGTLIMGKPGSYVRQNSLAKAHREMGSIEKTLFLVDYLAVKGRRRRIHKGLRP